MSSRTDTPDAAKPSAREDDAGQLTRGQLGRGSATAELVPWGIFLVGFVLFPIVFRTAYSHNVGVLICLTAIMALGWNLLGGFTGQISLGHALFFGIGAYSAAVGGAVLSLNPWLAMVGGVVLSAAVSGVIAIPIFRLRGHYFAITTIAIAEIALIVMLNWRWVGGASGLSIPIQPDSFWQLQWSGRLKWQYYYLALAIVTAVLVATRFLLRSRLGYYLIAIREDETAAAAVGIPVTRYKLIAFAFSAACVAVAGTLFAQYVLFVDPGSAFGLMISINLIIAAVIGGVRNMWGPVIGTVVFYAITEYTRLQFGGEGDAFNLMIYGLLVMVIAAFEPNGLIGLSVRFRRLLHRWRDR